MSPDGLFESTSTSTTTSWGSRRRSHTGWLWAFEVVSFPSAIRYVSEVAFQLAPRSTRSKSSVNGASMAGTLVRQAGREASASPSNEASRAPGIPGKYPPAPFASSGLAASSTMRKFMEKPPPDTAIADPDLDDPGRCGDPLEDHGAGENDVGAPRVEDDDSLALTLRRRTQTRDLAAEIGARKPVAVDARRIVARQRERHRGQGGDRARDADERRRLSRERDAPD